MAFQQIEKTPLIYLFLIISILTFLLYFRALDNPFTLGDYTHLYKKPLKQLLKNFISLQEYPDVLAKDYRPLRDISFAVDIRLAGFKPFLFHLHNLFWHISSAIALFYLIHLISKEKTIPLFASILFVVHPSSVEVVAWVCARGDLMCGCFYLLALTFALLYRKKPSFLFLSCFIVCSVFSILSKEMGITLPLALFFLLRHFKNNDKIETASYYSLTILEKKLLFLSFSISILYWLLRLFVFGGFGGYGILHFQLGRLLIDNCVRYFANLLKPIPFPELLNRILVDYPVIFFALILIILFSSKKYAFGILWILVVLIPVYSLLRNTNLYLASMGIAIFWSFLLLPDKHSRVRSFRIYIRTTTIILLLLSLFVLSYRRLSEWEIATFRAGEIISQLKQIKTTMPGGARLGFIGLPVHYKGVGIFGIGIDRAVELAYNDFSLQSFRLESLNDLAKHNLIESKEKLYIFHYKNGKVVEITDKFFQKLEEYSQKNTIFDLKSLKKWDFNCIEEVNDWTTSKKAKISWKDSQFLLWKVKTKGNLLKIELNSIPPSQCVDLEFSIRAKSFRQLGMGYISWLEHSNSNPSSKNQFNIRSSQGFCIYTIFLSENLEWILAEKPIEKLFIEIEDLPGEIEIDYIKFALASPPQISIPNKSPTSFEIPFHLSLPSNNDHPLNN